MHARCVMHQSLCHLSLISFKHILYTTRAHLFFTFQFGYITHSNCHLLHNWFVVSYIMFFLFVNCLYCVKLHNHQDTALPSHTRQSGVTSAFPTSLTTFLTTLFSLTGQSYDSNDTDTDITEVEDEKQSDICKASLLVFGLASAVVAMAYMVLITAYVVVNFT